MNTVFRYEQKGVNVSWYLKALKKYAVFSGRAGRKEYWMFFLINAIIVWGLFIVEGLAGGQGILSQLYLLATLIPHFAVITRRLHDTNRSAWWLLIFLVPLGTIPLLIFLVQDSQSVENQYGSNPKVVVANATA
jgi:uncharacterized membrane protein YhaH (DUF805 family)